MRGFMATTDISTVKIRNLPDATTILPSDLIVVQQEIDTTKVAAEKLISDLGLLEKSEIIGDSGASIIGTHSGMSVQQSLDNQNNSQESFIQQLQSTEGSSKIGTDLGGTVSDSLRYVSVDAFDPDLTGETDSTLAVLRAASVAKTLADSAYVTGDTTYYVVKYGFGIYMQGDVPIYSGIKYQGQSAGTLIKPLPGAAYCFTTTGTSPYSNDNLKRAFYAEISDLYIGCAYYETLFSIPAGVGGINVEYASYVRINNVNMRRLNGIGLNLSEYWDGDIVNLRMMYVGNSTDVNNPVPALRMSMGAGTDGCNAVRFWGLHIEACAKSIELKPGCRHVFFNSPKIEGGTLTSTIEGAAGINFSDGEFTWARNNAPQFTITRTSSYESFGVLFNCPQFINGGNSSRGWFIHHESDSGYLVLNNPMGKFVKTLITGNSWVSNGGAAYACGPNYMSGTWSCRVSGLVARQVQRTSTAGDASTDGSDDFIVLSGGGQVVKDCQLHSNGASNDGLSFINILGCNGDVLCSDNQFSGVRQIGIRNARDSYKIRNNSVIDGGTLVSVISQATPKYGLLNPNTSGLGVGGFKSGSVSVASETAGMLDIISGGSLFLIRASSALGFASALVHTDAAATTMTLLSSTGSIFSTGTGVAGDGKVYLAKSGTNLIFTNHNASAATFFVTSLSSVM